MIIAIPTWHGWQGEKENSPFVSVQGRLNLYGAAQKKKKNLLLNNERETMLHSLALEVIPAPMLKETTSARPSDTRGRPTNQCPLRPEKGRE